MVSFTRQKNACDMFCCAPRRHDPPRGHRLDGSAEGAANGFGTGVIGATESHRCQRHGRRRVYCSAATLMRATRRRSPRWHRTASMHAIERARSARVNAAGTKVVEHEIGGAFRRRGRLTADSGYAIDRTAAIVRLPTSKHTESNWFRFGVPAHRNGLTPLTARPGGALGFSV